MRAIYVMNHASRADPFLAMRLCPTGGVGIAKQQVRFIPVFGLAYWLSGHLLLDRSDRERRRRLPGPRPGHRPPRCRCGCVARGHPVARTASCSPFKRGFVHLAIATGLPVVPVVAPAPTSAGRRGRCSCTPGVIRVEFLPPVDTAGWTVERAEAHAALVRDRMAAALAAGELAPAP
ncbi:MAG: 1-acyl-sn-glycerol-3-phosphate acyltransferase [Bryobacterales bacterium]